MESQKGCLQMPENLNKTYLYINTFSVEQIHIQPTVMFKNKLDFFGLSIYLEKYSVNGEK